MPLESRSRMVSFRLTLEEYDRFRDLCYASGLRNVSEMVRAAVNHMLDNSPTTWTHPLESRLTDVECRLQDLTRQVESLHPAAYRQAAS